MAPDFPASTPSPASTRSPASTPQLTVQPINFAAEQPPTWQHLIDTARAADAAGIDRIIVSDHVVFGESPEAYGDPSLGGTAGGKQPTGPDGHWLEPLTTLAFLGGQTHHVRLGTSILLAALRRPAVLAKTAATLDVLSGGRLDLGVGVGWQAEEYEAAGLDFANRGRLLDHTLEVCQLLWTEQRATYNSDELAFDGIHAMPQPLQPAGVPIWVSGTVNPRAMKRLATFGTGWIPWGPAVADPLAGIAGMREAVEGFGRDPFEIQATCYIPAVRSDNGDLLLDETMAAVPALRDAGMTDFKITLKLPSGEPAITETFAEAVEAFRSVTR